MTAFKRFDTAAFFHNSEIPPAASAASAANTPSEPQLAAVAASAAGVLIENNEWDALDWKDYFTERAATLEFSGELNRPEAEAKAFEATIIRWMNATPPKNLDDDHCAQCGKPLGRIGEDSVPVLTGGGGHAWIHHDCHTAWMARRRKDAIKALTLFCINPQNEKGKKDGC